MKNSKKSHAPRNGMVVAMLSHCKGGPMKDRRAERGGSKMSLTRTRGEE